MAYLTRTQAAKLLHISTRHLDLLRKCEGLPYLRLGRRILICEEELRAWLRRRSESRRPGRMRDI